MTDASPSGCGETRHLLTAYIDGELSGDEASRLGRHIEDCVVCRERLDLERAFTAGLRARQLRDQAPLWLLEKVREALGKEASGGARGRVSTGRLGGWRLGLAGAGYALALVFALMWMGARGLIPGSPPGSAESASAAGQRDSSLWVPVSVQIRGQVVCVMCERAGVPAERHILCNTYGHFNGLRDESGRVWLLVERQGENAILEDHDMRGRRVEVKADVFEKTGYLIAWNVREL